MALQSGFLAPQQVKAVIAHYPMVDLRDRHYTEDYEKQLFDMPQFDPAILRDYVAGLQGDEAVTSAAPPERGALFASMIQQGSFGKFFGDDRALYPIEVLDQISEIPPTWLLHGKDDSVIPIQGTCRCVAALQKKHPEVKYHFSYRKGDHGFDNAPGTTLEEEWIRDGVEFIGKYGPRS